MRPRLSALAVSLVLAVGLPAGTARAQGLPADQGQRIQALVERLGRATPWTLTARVPLGFDAHHPEGLARVGERGDEGRFGYRLPGGTAVVGPGESK